MSHLVCKGSHGHGKGERGSCLYRPVCILDCLVITLWCKESKPLVYREDRVEQDEEAKLSG